MNAWVIGNGTFPIGAHVYREPCIDFEETLRDLPLLRRLGFTMVKIQEIWAHDEPFEGQYDLSRVEQLTARASELGLGVYLGLTMEQAPAWLWRKYPDCFMVYANGQPHNDPTQYCLPSDGKPGPCWDHPGARAAGEQFVAALVQRLARYENIWIWNTWQEIGFWPHTGGALGFCYCPHTLAAFQAWLQERYHSLAALNTAWLTAYGAWNEIEPPRRVSYAASFVDWRYFMDNVYLARALTWKTKALRAHDPRQRPVFCHVASPTIGSGAEWRWAQTADVFGNSNYPAWGSFHPWDDASNERERDPCLLAELQTMMLRGDLTRCAAGERLFWGAEFQGGPISTQMQMGRVPDASDIRRWMLAGLAVGMHGISFWNHRAERTWSECNGFGLLDPQGDTSERIEAVSRIGHALQEHAELFALGRTPRAPVALLVNEDLWHFCQGTPENTAELYAYNLRGHYLRLWRMGIPVDFVEAADVVQGALSAYKAAISPMPVAIDGEYALALQEFVANGGFLISDACPGRFDRYGFCTRAQLMPGGEALFGARHRHVQIVREPGVARWTPQERTWGEFAPATTLTGDGQYAGMQLQASFYLQTLTPTTGTPILRTDAAVAGVINRYVKGQAALLGTFAGLGAAAHADRRDDALFERLFADAGVSAERYGALLCRRRIHGNQTALFLLNPTSEAQTEQLPLPDSKQFHDLLGDTVVSQRGATLTIRVPALNFSCLVFA